jgi:hypothetical protein
VIRPAVLRDIPVSTFRNSQVRLAPSGTPGFNGRAAHAVSSRVIDAVAATLAVSSLSLGLAVVITLLSIRVSMAMPG